AGFPPGASLRCFFCSCVSDSIRLFRVRFPRCLSGSRSAFRLSRFPFRRFRLYQVLFVSLTTVTADMRNQTQG
ncbi:hypothetical protein E7X58_16840, partial [Streptomyces sp. A1499]